MQNTPKISVVKTYKALNIKANQYTQLRLIQLVSTAQLAHQPPNTIR